MMEPWMWAALGGVVLLLIVLVLVRRGGRKVPSALAGDAPYRRVGRLLSGSERRFKALVEEAAGDQFRLFPKVALSALLQPNALTEPLAVPPEGVLDFVMCSSEDLAVIAVIRLNEIADAPPVPQAAKGGALPEIDPVDDLLAAAEISVARFDASASYTVGEVQKILSESLSLPMKVFGQTRQQLEAKAEAPKAPKKPRMQGGAPTCPACDAPMVQRRAKQGKFAGQQFWVCSTFPTCKKILPIKVG